MRALMTSAGTAARAARTRSTCSSAEPPASSRFRPTAPASQAACAVARRRRSRPRDRRSRAGRRPRRCAAPCRASRRPGCARRPGSRARPRCRRSKWRPPGTGSVGDDHGAGDIPCVRQHQHRRLRVERPERRGPLLLRRHAGDSRAGGSIAARDRRLARVGGVARGGGGRCRDGRASRAHALPRRSAVQRRGRRRARLRRAPYRRDRAPPRRGGRLG